MHTPQLHPAFLQPSAGVQEREGNRGGARVHWRRGQNFSPSNDRGVVKAVQECLKGRGH